MLDLLVEGYFFVERVHRAVNLDARIAGFAKRFELLFELAFLPSRDGRGDEDFTALGVSGDLVDNLVDGLPRDFPAALRTVHHAAARVQKSQVVVDFGDRSHRGARIACGGFLVDGNCRTQSLDALDVGLLHLPQKQPRIRRQRLDVAALSFRENRVERERGFAAPGQAREHYQFVPRQREIYVFKVVLVRALYDDFVHCDYFSPM